MFVELNQSFMEFLHASFALAFTAALVADGRSPNSINTYLRHIRCALSWARKKEYIAACLRVDSEKRINRTRCGIIKPEDERKLMEAAKVVRPLDSPAWQRFINGLLLTGLRIGEALQLSSDEDAGIYLDMTDIPAVFRFAAETPKNGQETEAPMLDESENFFARTPVDSRHGWVFDLRSRSTCRGNASRDDASKVLSKIGKAAGVITKGNSGKNFSAHDCRATFATRLANRGVDPYDVMQLINATFADPNHPDILRQEAGKGCAGSH